MPLHVCASCTTRYAAGLEACPHCQSTDVQEEARPLLPAVWVVCGTAGCRSEGRVRQVLLRQIALGVLALPTLLCADCRLVMRETDMPKITRHGGATNARAEQPPAPAPQAAKRDAPAEPISEAASLPSDAVVVVDPAPEPVTADSTGEEEPSPGSSSETSSASTQTPSETSSPAPQKRARTTGSRSTKGRTASSSARSTGGGQAAGMSAPEEG